MVAANGPVFSSGHDLKELIGITNEGKTTRSFTAPRNSDEKHADRARRGKAAQAVRSVQRLDAEHRRVAAAGDRPSARHGNSGRVPTGECPTTRAHTPRLSSVGCDGQFLTGAAPQVATSDMAIAADTASFATPGQSVAGQCRRAAAALRPVLANAVANRSACHAGDDSQPHPTPTRIHAPDLNRRRHCDAPPCDAPPYDDPPCVAQA